MTCAVAAAIVYPTLLTLLYFVGLRHAPSAVQQGVYGGGKIVQFLFPWLICGCTWKLLAADRPIRRRDLAWGLATGILMAGGLLALYFGVAKSSPLLAPAAEQVTGKVQGFGITGPGAYFLLAAFYAIGHSLLEEYYWRWFVFGQLRNRWPLGPAIVVSSLGFMAHHVVVLATFFGGVNVPAIVCSLGVGLGGVVWAWMYHRSGALGGVWLSHAFVDAVIFIAGYNRLWP